MGSVLLGAAAAAGQFLIGLVDTALPCRTLKVGLRLQRRRGGCLVRLLIAL